MKSFGTMKVTGSGVTISKGRGAAKVSFDVDFSRLDRWARWMKMDAKKLWRQSYGRACNGLRAKLQKVISRAGGVDGLPKFKDYEDFTNILRARAGISNRPMGGILAGHKIIKAWKFPDGTQIIGWPDSLAEWAVKFQDGVGGSLAERYFTDPEWRARMHRRAASDSVPAAYVHNPRRVIPEPFGGYVRKKLDEWARSIYYKQLASLMINHAKEAK